MRTEQEIRDMLKKIDEELESAAYEDDHLFISVERETLQWVLGDENPETFAERLSGERKKSFENAIDAKTSKNQAVVVVKPVKPAVQVERIVLHK